MYTPDGSETLYITELIFGNSDSCITFLSLNLDGMRPVYRDSRVILFNEISEAKSALRSSNCGAGMLMEIPCEIENKLDFAQAIIDLEDVIREKSETIEYTGNFVDCLQFFVDVYFDTIHEKNTDAITTAEESESEPESEPKLEEENYKTPLRPGRITDPFYRILFQASQFFLFNPSVQEFVYETGLKADELLSAIKYALGDLIMCAFYLEEEN